MYSISPLRYRWPFLAKLFFFLLTIATLALPIPYVFFSPGTPNDVAGDLIKIKDADSYPVNGNLFITSILVTNPNTPVFGAETIYNWSDGEHVVLPKTTVYPPTITGQESQRSSKDEMTISKITATAAALNYLGYRIEPIYYIDEIRSYSKASGILQEGDRILRVDGKLIADIEEIRSAYQGRKVGDQIEIEIERSIDGKASRLTKIIELVPNQESKGDKTLPAIGILVGTSAKLPVSVEFGLRGVGGPSAGMIFAVGIIEKLQAEDLLRGRKVAGTGSITAAGKVGSIGGIEEKMIGASRKGATIFLAPRGNCPDIKHVPTGLKVIPVSTLSEAIAALRAPDNFRFPTC